MNNIETKNLELLINREKGQLFDVDAEGNLSSLSRFQKIRYIVQESYRQAIQQRLKPIVSSLVGRITDETELSSLKRLPVSIFDRTALNAQFIESLTPALEKSTDNAEMNQMIQKIQLAFRLGIRPKPPGEGCSGSYFLKDINGKNLVIFKPMDEEVLASNSSKLTSKIKRLFYRIFHFMYPTALSCMSGSGYLAEEAASRISEALGLDTVPLTRSARFTHPDFNYSSKERAESVLPEKLGSLQTFVDGAETAEVVLGVSNLFRFVPLLAKKYLERSTWREFLDQKITQEEFEKFVIIDFLDGNLDRHFGNWMLAGKKIFAIDNGYSMPPQHTSSRRTNQHLWMILPQAARPFGEKAQEIVETLKQKNLPQMLSDYKLINESQRKSFEERIAIATGFVKNKMCPLALGFVKKPKDFEDAFKLLGVKPPLHSPAGA